MGLPLRKSKVELPATCPLVDALAMLRGAWAPNVIWSLSAGPRRFGELRTDLPGISARILSKRLRELETQGIVTRQQMDTSPPTAQYALSELGSEFLPVIRELAAVGRKLRQLK
ncbi:helix-turn-helix domain-containing protein [Pseudomonas sp. L13]|uniref:winged helix-turn-helix transcriptional regulator n=1 Tax=Pseudomonas sp. L13 TaxID=343985 RepID=UPI001379CB14|nr:helix-turn-helix domain-containing protein [Pseudomonas sp. L13]NCE89695.1 transcriptional regulator [Pseudomonas sp. L13]